MNKKIRIFESELINMVKTIVEQVVDLDSYDALDFEEVFFTMFKNYIVDKLGEDAQNYPFSFLLKKYGKEFIISKLGETIFNSYKRSYSDDVDYDSRIIQKIGRELVKLSLAKLPSLRKEYKFTEKYAKHLERLVKMLELPDFVDVEFKEENSHDVKMLLKVDFDDLLKSERGLDRYSITRNMRELLENYLGVDFESPSYGGLRFDVSLSVDGIDEWTKNVLNKKIKKHIKSEIPDSNMLHSIRFKPKTDGHSELTLHYKDMTPWGKKNEIKNAVVTYIKSLGYNRISVDNP